MFKASKLQSFPKSFEFPESVPRTQRYVQIGNAVATSVAEKLSRRIYLKIKNERRSK